MDTDSITALRRFGLGPRPGEWRTIAADPRGFVLDQCRPRLPVPADLPDSAALFVGYSERFAVHRDLVAAGSEDRSAVKALNKFVEGAYRDELRLLFSGMHQTDAGLVERLVLFWANHFTVAARSRQTKLLVGPYVREAIRPYVLGRFSDMLRAVATHPAMLHYLDAIRSIGPNSENGQRLGRGLNENLAREILELHTLGVGGGYDQADVTAFANILTGWTLWRPPSPGAGRFRFEPRSHEPGDFTVLGTLYRADGVAQGGRVLADLARHPATARRIAGRLARHFVGDAADPGLVDLLAARYAETDGDLAAVTAALVGDDRAWAPPPVKLLPPIDMVVAAGRALGRPVPLQTVLTFGHTLGQVPFVAPSPEGFPDGDASWASPDGLLTRLDVAIAIAAETDLAGVDLAERADALWGPSLGAATLTAVRRAESREQAAALLLMSPDLQRR